MIKSASPRHMLAVRPLLSLFRMCRCHSGCAPSTDRSTILSPARTPSARLTMPSPAARPGLHQRSVCLQQFGRRSPAAHNFQSDRRPDREQSRRRGRQWRRIRAVVSPGLDGIFGTADDVDVFFIPNSTPDAGLTRAIQCVDDVLRPVLRSRPRPGDQVEHRNHIHSAAAGRSAFRPRQPDQFHGAGTRDAGERPGRGRYSWDRRRHHA